MIQGGMPSLKDWAFYWGMAAFGMLCVGLDLYGIYTAAELHKWGWLAVNVVAMPLGILYGAIALVVQLMH